MATQTCPKCSKSFRVMEDEANDLHDCPNCGYDGLSNWKATLTITIRARDKDDASEKFWDEVNNSNPEGSNIEIERGDE